MLRTVVISRYIGGNNLHEEYTKSKTIDEEANNPCCLTLYDMACKMAAVVDPLNIQEIASPVPFTASILIYRNSSDCFYWNNRPSPFLLSSNSRTIPSNDIKKF